MLNERANVYLCKLGTRLPDLKNIFDVSLYWFWQSDTSLILRDIFKRNRISNLEGLIEVFS